MRDFDTLDADRAHSEAQCCRSRTGATGFLTVGRAIRPGGCGGVGYDRFRPEGDVGIASLGALEIHPRQ
jgi:hypothetical protein